jgi:hypothetical protein
VGNGFSTCVVQVLSVAAVKIDSGGRELQSFPVRLPSGARYWTVIDDDLRPVPVADAYLRHVRFGRDDAESPNKSYAGAVAL